MAERKSAERGASRRAWGIPLRQGPTPTRAVMPARKPAPRAVVPAAFPEPKRVSLAESIADGVATARETRFDVVAAPGVGGDLPLAELVAALRATGRTRGVPKKVTPSGRASHASAKVQTSASNARRPQRASSAKTLPTSAAESSPSW